MKKMLPVIAVVCLIAGMILLRTLRQPVPEGETESAPAISVKTGPAVTFAMAYRGLSGKKDDMQPIFGSSCRKVDECESVFIKAVQEKAGRDLPVFRVRAMETYGPDFVAVQYRDGAPAALYYDLDADGVVDENEVMEPQQEAGEEKTTAFITPDFVITGPNGKNVPMRVLFRAPSELTDKPYVHCSAMSLFEGTATLDGSQMRLILYSDLSSPGYTEFGKNRYVLVPTSTEYAKLGMQSFFNKDGVRWLPLSSMILHEGKFYQVRVDGSDEVGKSLTIHLAENLNPRGKVAVRMDGNEGLKTETTSITLGGDRVCLDLSGGTDELPAGQYLLEKASVKYGTGEALDKGTYFTLNKPVTVTGGETTTLTVSRPEVIISARLKQGEQKPQTTFAEGAEVEISVAYRGAAGEEYRYLCEIMKNAFLGGDYWKPVMPELKIIDSAGQTLVTHTFEYG